MKINRLFTIAAATLMMVACSSEETALNNTPAAGSQMKFTATIAAPNSGATTRTEYTEVTTGEAAGTINVAWKVGDEIALIHNGVKDVATVKAVNADGSATIIGNVTNVKNGDDVEVCYPAALWDWYEEAEGAIRNAEFVANIIAQDGTLKYIQDNLDVRMGEGELKVDGDKVTLNADVKLESQIAIWKLTLQDDAETPAALSATQVILKVDDPAATIARTTEDLSKTSTVYLALDMINEEDLTIEATVGEDTYVYTQNGVILEHGNYYQSTVTMTKKAGGVDLSKLTADYEAQDGDVLTGTLAGNYKISIADGATVTLDGVTINGYNSSDYKWAGITCEGDAIIILKDGSENTVKGFYDDYPGITCPVENTLTIKGETLGTGSLTASSNGYGAGIGGGFSISCGNIDIQGGVITATGVYNSPGIGAGQGASIGPSTCGTITISGGTVTAIGGTNSAGIGSGYASSNPSTCDAITISGGTVTATAGENAPAAIGKGEEDEGESTCASVTLGNITSVSMTNATQTGLVGDFVNATALNVGESPITDYLDQNVIAVTSVMMQAGYTSNLSGNTWTVAKQ